ncbi:MAG: hypothetical protein H6Q91_1829, partial [Deltaproteobacteria bacterium]|nr:hypothetical protein [Deltaproteobacteria bacterium]
MAARRIEPLAWLVRPAKNDGPAPL